MAQKVGRNKAKVQMKTWAVPGEGETLVSLSAKFVERGYTILEKDEQNQRILVAQSEDEFILPGGD